MKKVREAYAWPYDFHVVTRAAVDLVAVELSARFFDVSKDRLYCGAPSGAYDRRSAQTAIHELADVLCRCLAPVLSFTAEEAYGYLPGHLESVFLAGMPAVDERAIDPGLEEAFARLLQIREDVQARLELLRRDKVIGSSQEARVELWGAARSDLIDLGELFIVSEVDLAGRRSASPTPRSVSAPGLKLRVTTALRASAVTAAGTTGTTGEAAPRRLRTATACLHVGVKEFMRTAAGSTEDSPCALRSSPICSEFSVPTWTAILCAIALAWPRRLQRRDDLHPRGAHRRGSLARHLAERTAPGRREASSPPILVIIPRPDRPRGRHPRRRLPPAAAHLRLRHRARLSCSPSRSPAREAARNGIYPGETPPRNDQQRAHARDTVLDLAFWVLLSAIVGSRLYFIAVNWTGPEGYAEHPGNILKFWTGGLVFYGGFLGAVTASIVYAQRAKFNFIKLADLAIPTVSLGQFFGRLGCFAAGCCYGKPISGALSAIGVKFPQGSLAWDALVNQRHTLAATPAHTDALLAQPAHRRRPANC